MYKFCSLYFMYKFCSLYLIACVFFKAKTYEPVREKTNNLHKRKQSRRSASR